jgi:hypothetical protein
MFIFLSCSSDVHIYIVNLLNYAKYVIMIELITLFIEYLMS